jgi:hypothetical protein
MSVAEIKAAIPHLTLEQRAEIARALHQWLDDDWDHQMKQDLASGKLAKLLDEVDADIDKGRVTDLP